MEDNYTIPVAEIFGPTIQGEGPDVGKRVIFIRVNFCDFKCKWCFGIQPNSYRVPRVIKTNEKITDKKIFNNVCGTTLDKVVVGDTILTYDENLKLVPTKVKDVLTRKAKCLKIKIGNVTYLVTPEHPFFTERGMICADKLVPGDKIIKLKQHDLNMLVDDFNEEYMSNNSTVVSIEPYDKEIDVINLSCEPYNTYLADGMWVHNCDSSWAWHENQNTIRYTPKDLALQIINKCRQNNCFSVIITGGNPCIYDMSEIIHMLHENNIHVGIETQGSLLPKWLCDVDTLVFSPKAPSSEQPDTYVNITKYIDNEEYKLSQMIAVKIPVFDDKDIEYAQKFSKYINDKYIQDVSIKNTLRMYLSVGNVDTTEEGDISRRVLTTYENLLNTINEKPDYFENVYILPQIHTLIWGNKSGV